MLLQKISSDKDHGINAVSDDTSDDEQQSDNIVRYIMHYSQNISIKFTICII